MREEINQEPQPEPKSESQQSYVDRLERRRMIRAAVASVPVVLTFSAGTAHAQDASIIDSQAASPDTAEDEESIESDEAASEDDEAKFLTPAEELETFGLERVERPESYDENPFRNLDSVHPEIDVDSP